LKKITGTTFAFVLLTAAGSAWAQPHKGSGTFTLAGQINTQIPGNGADPTAQGMFNIGFGKFVASRTQLFLGPTLNISAGETGTGGSSIHAGLGATVGIKQLFGGAASKTLPYIGLHATVLDFSSSSTATGIEGEEASSSFLNKMYVGTTLGLKSYFKENVALDLSAQMGAQANNIGSGLRNISLVAAIEYVF
jgi:hypothetical protein